MENEQVQNEDFRTDALAQLIKELGIDTLAQDKQDELMIKMTEVLLKRIFLETMDKLGDDGREAYGKLTEEEASPEQIEGFFKERISDYDSMVQQVIMEFKKEMTVPESA